MRAKSQPAKMSAEREREREEEEEEEVERQSKTQTIYNMRDVIKVTTKKRGRYAAVNSCRHGRHFNQTGLIGMTRNEILV
ncbi:hypothetical protein RUM44_010398 [Polyplax serrata]|uniref:Uncharacterized protein n=1 Tax=Polyplax serrata TaxID=468196 RepID=A0ABR1AVG5_POLSC